MVHLSPAVQRTERRYGLPHNVRPEAVRAPLQWIPMKTGAGAAVGKTETPASDILTLPLGLRGLRRSQAHLSDVESVIADLRAKFPGLPVWVNGTSRGTISAAAYAARTPSESENAARGLVMTSPVTVPSGPPNEELAEVALDAITVPTIIGVHLDDGCFVTPPENASDLASSLGNASKVRVVEFHGGTAALTQPCQALSEHGFLGIERRVTRRIARFVRRHHP